MNNDPISRTPGLRRRQVIQAGASALPVLAWGPAQGQQKFVFRMAHSEAIGAPLTLALQKWCDTLNTRSGGRIDAQHFSGQAARTLGCGSSHCPTACCGRLRVKERHDEAEADWQSTHAERQQHARTAIQR